MDPIYITFTCHLHTLYGIKKQWFRHKKYLRHTDALFKLMSFLLFSLKLKVLTFPVPTGPQKQSRAITAAPLPVLAVEQWPLNAHWATRAFYFQGNYFLKKNVNALKYFLFFEEFLLFHGSYLEKPWHGQKQRFLNFFTVLLHFCSAFRENGVGRTELWLNHSAKWQAFCMVAANQR